MDKAAIVDPAAQHPKNVQPQALLREPRHQSAANLEFVQQVESYWQESPGSVATKLQNFTKYVAREDLTKFLARTEVFKRQLHVHGSVIDIGVARGASLLTWLQLSAVYEPVNYNREIVGFDTFGGIPHTHPVDHGSTRVSEHVKTHGFAVEPGMADDVRRAVELHDQTRYLSHIPKAQIVVGDVTETVPRFLAESPHLVVSLLNIDVDLYESTKVALRKLVPRMPRGAVIIFDEVNVPLFPGETVALQETLGLNGCRLRRFSYAPTLSYVVIGD